MQKLYTRINWENEPSIETPLNEQNLNRMDAALNLIDDRVISQDAIKADKTELNNLVADWSINEETGIITITKKSGEKILFDLNIEKIPVSFSLSDDGILTMVTEDGTAFTANIGAMIPVLTFADSDDIAVSVSGSGVNKTYSFSIKTGSVTQDKLNPDFLSDMQVAAANAEAYAQSSQTSAKEAESYAHGGTGTREGEDTDNALYYKEQAKSEADRAKTEADRASDIVGIGIATTEKAGIVKPDGDTIEIAEDGTIRVSKVGNLSALTLPYNGADDTETTKEVVDALKTEFENIVIPTKTSDLLNDSDYQTGADVSAAINDIEIPEGNIESISVNGSNVSPDVNKNVNIVVPTKTSQLQNDSSFASIDDVYVKANALVGNSALFQDVARYASGLKTLASDGKSVSNTAVGSATRPIYFANGVPVAGSYTLGEACTKGVTTGAIAGNTNLITSGAVFTALQNAGGASEEEGTWTPTDAGGTLTSRSLSGRYRKVGKIVSLVFSASAASSSPSISNTPYFWLRNLPLQPANSNCCGIAVLRSPKTEVNIKGILGSIGGPYDANGIMFRPPQGYSGITLQAGEGAFGFATYITD